MPDKRTNSSNLTHPIVLLWLFKKLCDTNIHDIYEFWYRFDNIIIIYNWHSFNFDNSVSTNTTCIMPSIKILYKLMICC